MLKQQSLKSALLIIVSMFLVPLLLRQACASAAPASPVPPTKTFKIRFEVSEGSNQIENATVILESLERGIKFNKSVRTGRGGLVIVSAVPQGKVRIMVIAKGYKTFGKIHNFSKNDSIKISLIKT